MPQFNGKQEGESTRMNLTCAAPATVSRRETWCTPGPQLSSRSHWTTPVVVWEGDEGCSVSPDTGQQGGGASGNRRAAV